MILRFSVVQGSMVLYMPLHVNFMQANSSMTVRHATQQGLLLHDAVQTTSIQRMEEASHGAAVHTSKLIPT